MAGIATANFLTLLSHPQAELLHFLSEFQSSTSERPAHINLLGELP